MIIVDETADLKDAADKNRRAVRRQRRGRGSGLRH
jgi:hypothetical protein